MNHTLEQAIERLEAGTMKRLLVPQLEDSKEAERLADAIRANGKLQDFVMRNGDNSAQICRPLFAALAEQHSLRELQLDGNWLLNRQAKAVAAIIRSNPDLQSFSIMDCGLTEEGLPPLIDALKECTSLQRVNFGSNSLKDVGAAQVASLLETCPALVELDVTACDIGTPGIEALDKALKGKSRLASFSARLNHCEKETSERLAETLMQNIPHNLVNAQLPRGVPQLAEHCRINNKKVTAIQNTLSELEEHEDLSAHETKLVLRYTGALEYFEDMNDVLELLHDNLDFIELPTNEKITPELLSSRRPNGLCPLDHPGTWQQFDRIAQELAENGTPITREFLDQKNRNGESFLAIGLTHAPETVLRALNEAGMRLGKDDLLAPETERPTALYKALAEDNALQVAFTYDNWKDATPGELRDTYRALPAEGQAQIGNYHSLKTVIDGLNNAPGRGR